MSFYISPEISRQVRQRANEACEYCLLPQELQEATFHVDHILPRVDNGQTSLENLALACVACSLRKAAKTKGIDPKSTKIVALFNPRLDTWSRHFRLAKSRSIDRTNTYRASNYSEFGNE